LHKLTNRRGQIWVSPARRSLCSLSLRRVSYDARTNLREGFGIFRDVGIQPVIVLVMTYCSL